MTAVGSGKEFDLAFGTEVFDIAIIDVNLLNISGFEIAQRIKQQTHLGIIILTARTLRDDKLQGYAGGNMYLTKPVNGNELAFVIKNLTDRLGQPDKNLQRTASTNGQLVN